MKTEKVTGSIPVRSKFCSCYHTLSTGAEAAYSGGNDSRNNKLTYNIQIKAVGSTYMMLIANPLSLRSLIVENAIDEGSGGMDCERMWQLS